MHLDRHSTVIQAENLESSKNKHVSDAKTIALAGNPNVGKSTIFNSLTGLRQHTGNWPGKTVLCAQGSFRLNGCGYTLVDLPGCYSLAAMSADEAAARDFLLSDAHDAVIVVCDATCLERSLALALQAMEICTHVTVCVNLLDEAAKNGIKIDLDLLASRLGTLVIGTSAGRKNGLDALKSALPSIFDTKRELSPPLSAEQIMQRVALICDGVVSRPQNAFARDRAVDRVLSGRISAFPVMLLGLLSILWLTIVGANYPSRALSAVLFSMEAPLLSALRALNAPEMLTQILVSGVYRTLAWVVSVMLPPMAIFFPLFTLLEDAGYLPRVAFNLDRCFKGCRACGKQALTMCMGL